MLHYCFSILWNSDVIILVHFLYYGMNPIYGDYSGGDHLFPFRTEKLSPPAQMVLSDYGWESMSLPFFTKPCLDENLDGVLFFL